MTAGKVVMCSLIKLKPTAVKSPQTAGLSEQRSDFIQKFSLKVFNSFFQSNFFALMAQ